MNDGPIWFAGGSSRSGKELHEHGKKLAFRCFYVEGITLKQFVALSRDEQVRVAMDADISGAKDFVPHFLRSAMVRDA